MAIEGKVAAILNERELVINKGTDAGVKGEMKFKVMEPGVDIKDPDTGEPLGTIQREKIRVEIVEVHPRYSVGRTYETYVISVAGLGSDVVDAITRWSPLLGREVTRVRTLRTDRATAKASNDRSCFVEVGDQIAQVVDHG